MTNEEVLKHFHACENCEPLMCCSGHMCGCYGMPYDFKHTDKCGDNCELKKYAEENKDNG